MLNTIDDVLLKDVETFTAQLNRFKLGEIDLDAWKHFRLRYGVYGQKQPDVQMIRVKLPYGGLRPHQLHRLAEIASEFGNGIGHVTTRQDLQFHFIPLDRIPAALARLADVGLTTREACGNTVRNVTACPLAGVHGAERFDVTPYARAVSNHFLRRDLTQNLPRKFKIAFSGCPEECAGAAFHDIGALAALRDGVRGFRLYVGGGLGNTPRPATLLEDFTPEDDLLRTTEAIIAVFNADGQRKNRNRARLKFLIETLGWDEFKRRVLDLRATLPPARIDRAVTEEQPSVLRIDRRSEPRTPEFAAWKASNVIPQKQDGFVAVQVTLPLGDVTAAHLHALAKIGALYADGYVRATPAQNIVLRWVRVENVSAVYERLAAAGLAEAGAEQITDVTSCPGAATCSLAFTASKGLAEQIREVAAAAPESARNLRVKISGCPNSCGQHHVADIGFYGNNLKVDGRDVPAYAILVGGSNADGSVDFGLQIARIPARRTPAAFAAILLAFDRERAAAETFSAFARRVGKAGWESRLAPYTAVDAAAYTDWGADAAFTAPRAMKGECA